MKKLFSAITKSVSELLTKHNRRLPAPCGTGTGSIKNSSRLALSFFSAIIFSPIFGLLLFAASAHATDVPAEVMYGNQVGGPTLYFKSGNDACAFIVAGSSSYSNPVYVPSDPQWGRGCQYTYVNPTNGQPTPITIFDQNWVSPNTFCPQGYGLYGNVCKCTDATLCPKEPPSCEQDGNPIFRGYGIKRQIETDYVGAGSYALHFERTYNSLQGGNDYRLQAAGDLPLGGFGSKWLHTYARSIDLISNSALTRVLVYRPNGALLIFQPNGSNWTADADVADTLTQQTDASGNITGWTYRVATSEETEMYNAQGILQSVSNRAGLSQALIYSSVTTPPTIAPRANLLIHVTDSFGRQLNFTYNSKGQMRTMTDPSGGVYTYVYDASYARLSSVQYPDTKVRTYLYDEAAYSDNSLTGALTGIMDESGQRFATFTYANGKAASTQHAGNVDKYSLSYSSNQTVVTDPLSSARIYNFQNVLGIVKGTGQSQPSGSGCGPSSSAVIYDTNGNVSSRTDFNGNVTNYIYDLTRNLETSRTEAYGTPQARTITTQWHATYRLPTLITEPGKTTSFGYDTNGNLLTKTITDTALSKSRTWTWTYNSLGQVLTADGSRTDVPDITTNTYYSSASSVAGSVHSIGDLATVTNAAGQVTSITSYDLNGRPLSITDPNGVVTTLTYWPRGWLKSRTVAGTQTTTYDYDGISQLVKVTLPDLSYLNYTYDAAHRLTDITDNAGNKTHYTLDAMSNRIQEDTKDPSGSILKTRSRIFDALNRLQKDIGGSSPATQITQYGYDNNGNLKTITDPLNHVTTNGYDALNRLISITDPANGVSTTAYNALDQVTQVKDPRLVATNYTIDALGNVTLTQSPDSGNTQTVFDAAGNATQKTDARDVVSNYTYDALNRVTSITYPANTAENVSFTYDSVANGNKGIGKLTGYSNDGGATVLVYDSFGNITQQTEQIGSQYYVTAYQYDTANRLSQITYPSGRIVIYTRNTLGQITQVQTKDTATASLVTIISNATYEPFGPLKTLTYGNGVTSTLLHDADYRTSRITITSTPTWDYQYSYDAAGNLLQQTDQISTLSKTFGYDNLDRVTSDVNDTGNWTYQYDANGNRTKRIWVNTSNVTNTQTLTYATTSNRQTKNGSSTITEDAAGNITSNGQTLTYNNANHLIQVSSGSTVKAGFTYNALNQRTAKTQIAKPVHFQYGLGGEILGIALYNGTPLYQRNDYIWLDQTPIAQVRTIYTSTGGVSSRRTNYLHADHLNTPRVMTDSTKRIVWRWDGDAYGSQKPNENPDGDSTTDSLSLRFPGQFADGETGFSYNWNRYFDPATGRYVQSDPIGLQGGLNTYGYVNGNPISDIDPLGLAANLFCDDNLKTCRLQCGKRPLLSGPCLIKCEEKYGALGDCQPPPPPPKQCPPKEKPKPDPLTPECTFDKWRTGKC